MGKNNKKYENKNEKRTYRSPRMAYCAGSIQQRHTELAVVQHKQDIHTYSSTLRWQQCKHKQDIYGTLYWQQCNMYMNRSYIAPCTGSSARQTRHTQHPVLAVVQHEKDILSILRWRQCNTTKTYIVYCNGSSANSKWDTYAYHTVLAVYNLAQ